MTTAGTGRAGATGWAAQRLRAVPESEPALPPALTHPAAPGQVQAQEPPPPEARRGRLAHDSGFGNRDWRTPWFIETFRRQPLPEPATAAPTINGMRPLEELEDELGCS